MCGQIASGDRAGAGVLCGVEVRDPLRGLTEPVGQEFVGVAEVPVGLALVAEGRVNPAGLRGDQRPRRGYLGPRGGALGGG
ncbi:hypothetical protein [Streptomyces gardneri]|uniref:hypothetical protein n=1 Tax=Streptomyces gardneri TaxID=66892 RepID=UPI0037D0D9E1